MPNYEGLPITMPKDINRNVWIIWRGKIRPAGITRIAVEVKTGEGDLVWLEPSALSESAEDVKVGTG